jgi:hypothetical protein
VIVVADLVAKLALDAKGFSAGVSQATKQTDDLSKSLGTLPGPLGQAQASLGAFVKNLTGPAGAVGLIAAATVGLVRLATAAGEAVSQIHDLSIRTGASAETLSALQVAAKTSGTSLESVAIAFQRMAVSIQGASRGSTEQIAAFERLRVSVSELKTLSPEEQFERLARALMELPTATERAAAGQEVFGRSVATLLPLLDEVATRGMGPLIAEARRLGMVMSADAAKAADRFGDELDKLGFALKGVGQQIGLAVLPSLTTLVTGLTDGIVKAREFAKEMQKVQEIKPPDPASWTGWLTRLWEGSIFGLVAKTDGFIDRLVAEANRLRSSFEHIEALEARRAKRGAGAPAAAPQTAEQLATLRAGLAGLITVTHDLDAAVAESEGRLLDMVEITSEKRRALINLEYLDRVAQAKGSADQILLATATLNEQLILSDRQAAAERKKIIEQAVTDSLAALQRLRAQAEASDKEFKDRLRAGAASPFGTGLDVGDTTQANQALTLTLEKLQEISTIGQKIRSLGNLKLIDPTNVDIAGQSADAMKTLRDRAEQLRTSTGLSKEAFDKLLGPLPGSLTKAGEAADTLADPMKAIGEKTPALVTALAPAEDAFSRVAKAASDYGAALDRINRAMDEAARKAKALEVPLTGSSLDDAFHAVATAGYEAGTGVEQATSAMRHGGVAAVTYGENLMAIHTLGTAITAANLSAAFNDQALALLQAGDGANRYADSLERVAEAGAAAASVRVGGDVNEGQNMTLGGGQMGGHFWLGIGADKFIENFALQKQQAANEERWRQEGRGHAKGMQTTLDAMLAALLESQAAWHSIGGAGITPTASALPPPNQLTQAGSAGTFRAGASTSRQGATVVINNPVVDNERRVYDLGRQIQRVIEDQERRRG